MEAAASADASKRDHFTFGGGRRICPGMHLAEKSMFLGISRLLWGFNFAPVEGFVYKTDLEEGLVTQYQSFPAKIVPRSEARTQKIREEWRDCGRLLDDEMQWQEVPERVVQANQNEWAL